MRPEILFCLFRPLSALDGVGPRLEQAASNLCGGRKVIDALWHLPTGLVDRRYSPTIDALIAKISETDTPVMATVDVEVVRHDPPPKRGLPWRVLCRDAGGFMTLVYFHARKDWLETILPKGETRVVSGKAERYKDTLQMPHPDYVLTPQEAAPLRTRLEPVYGAGAGISSKQLTRMIETSLATLPQLPEWLDKNMMDKHGWSGWHDSLKNAHTPTDSAALAPQHPARMRLAYDELLANQLTLLLGREMQKKRAGIAVTGTGTYRRIVLDALPFTLTAGQEKVLAEIDADMAAPSAMHRLLQGDVGSGKTVIALLCMLSAIENGMQAVFMAPTDTLVRQHFASIAPLIERVVAQTNLHTNHSIMVLTGREKGKTRAAVLDALKDGTCTLCIGTHALFQEEVTLHNPAVMVIDEQHRFGVEQRLRLGQKGRGLNVLAMTATPIPRTLAMTAYGDMDVSYLTEKPAGRVPVKTVLISIARLQEVTTSVKRAVAKAQQIYWVCPLVEESDALDLAAAEERYQALQEYLGDGVVGLVHGRMKGEEREAVMQAFSAGDIAVLVATTVIEVGVDVPEASIMIIEHAERFGLAQLHQLRGRVGRGVALSSCLLLYDPALGETALARLRTMKQSDDGFYIAEQDLKLRGAGELLGTRQSGLVGFRLARLEFYADLLAMAQDDAKLILHTDPDLNSPHGQALRTLLYLFERDDAFRQFKGA